MQGGWVTRQSKAETFTKRLIYKNGGEVRGGRKTIDGKSVGVCVCVRARQFLKVGGHKKLITNYQIELHLNSKVYLSANASRCVWPTAMLS